MTKKNKNLEVVEDGEYVNFLMEKEAEIAEKWWITSADDDDELGTIQWNDEADEYVFVTEGCWLPEGSMSEILAFLTKLNQ